MRRTKPRLTPSMDSMETRLLLSAAVRLASAQGLSQFVHEVKAIVNTLARTENTVQANAQLTGLASQISPSSLSLATSWQNDVAFYRPGSQKSAITTQKRIIAELHRYLDDNAPPGSGTSSTPPSTPSPGTGGTTIPGSTTTPGQGTSAPYPYPVSTACGFRISRAWL